MLRGSRWVDAHVVEKNRVRQASCGYSGLLAANAVQTFVTRVIGAASSFALGIVAARILGPTGAGTYALALMCAGLFTTLFGNISYSVGHAISKEKYATHRILSTSVSLALAVGVVAMAVSVLTGWRWPQLGWVLPIGLAAPVVILGASCNWALVGIERVRSTNHATLAGAVTALVVMPVAAIRWQVIGAVSAWCLGQVISGVWLARSAGIAFRTRLLPRFDPPVMASLLLFGINIAGANAISYLNYRIDSLMVLDFLGTHELGIYSMAIQLSESIWFFASAVSTAMFARVGRGSQQDAGRVTATAARMVLIAAIAAGTVLAASARLLFSTLLGKEFLPAVPAFQVLIPGVVAYSLAPIVSVFFSNQLGRPSIATAIAALSMLINLLVSWLLIPRMGIVGAAIGTTSSYLISMAVGCATFIHFSDEGIRSLIPTRTDIDRFMKWRS